MDPSVEIVSIGTELLIGKILNTNVHWLAKRITSLGLPVHRIITIRDDVNEISNALLESMQRHPIFIITTGGLGPTLDDKTLEGIAKALDCKLEIDDQAMKFIEEKYRRYVEEGLMEKVELTSPRKKMAKIPIGAKPLFNPVGTAPGVLLRKKSVVVISLPGVPPEMKAVFEESVVPLLKEAVGKATFFEASIEAMAVMESEIASTLGKVMQNNPYVYIKSHPKIKKEHTQKISHLELHLSTTAEDSKVAKKRVSNALTQLIELVESNGGKIKPSKKL